MTEREQPSELEGGGDEQTWGQGEDVHQPTIPAEGEDRPTAYPEGEGAELGDPETLTREDEAMER